MARPPWASPSSVARPTAATGWAPRLPRGPAVSTPSSPARSASRWAASSSCSRPRACRSSTRRTRPTGRSSVPTRAHRPSVRPSASGSRSRRDPSFEGLAILESRPPGRSWPGAENGRSRSAIRPRPSRPGWRASAPAPPRCPSRARPGSLETVGGTPSCSAASSATRSTRSSRCTSSGTGGSSSMRRGLSSRDGGWPSRASPGRGRARSRAWPRGARAGSSLATTG